MREITLGLDHWWKCGWRGCRPLYQPAAEESSASASLFLSPCPYLYLCCYYPHEMEFQLQWHHAFPALFADHHSM